MPSKIRIYNSFEEADASEIKRSANQSGMERIEETVALILRVYNVTREQLRTRNKKKTITVISYH